MLRPQKMGRNSHRKKQTQGYSRGCHPHRHSASCGLGGGQMGAALGRQSPLGSHSCRKASVGLLSDCHSLPTA